MSSVRCIIFDESSKSVTINYLNDVKTILYDDNIKRIYYDTLKDMRSCDDKITEYDVRDIVEALALTPAPVPCCAARATEALTPAHRRLAGATEFDEDAIEFEEVADGI